MDVDALVTADLHLDDNSINRYRHEWIKNELPRLIRQYSPRYLIILGDLTNDKDRHCAELVNAVVSYLHTLTHHVKQVIILRGNHDCLDPTNPFFEFVKYIPDITWITSPKVITLEGLGNCCFLPHTRNHEKDWKDISFDPIKRDPNTGWIFCHNTFEGAKNENGQALKGIPVDVFPTNAKALSGDVHVPQRVGPVTYVGAPYTIRFGDKYTPRVRLLYRNGKELRMSSQICFGPQKRVIEIINITKLDKHVEEFNEGDLLKLRVHLKAEEYAKWSTIKEQLRNWYTEEGGVVCEIQPIKQTTSLKLDKKTISTRTDQQLLKTYVKRRGLANDILKTGLWLMEQT